jgi:prepilin-type N-terminal cleavage/methylation domain-containing protein
MNQRGMSLAEVVVSLAIVSIIIFTFLSLADAAMTTTRHNVDREFGTQKAMAILEELRALVQSTTEPSGLVLDSFDDGTTPQAVLTTLRIADSNGNLVPVDPDHESSGNKTFNNDWLYYRKIAVMRLPGAQSSDVRLVRVQILKNTGSGLRPLAEVASVLSTVATQMPPTQVFDLYAIAVENVPGWWVYMSNLRPFVENFIQDLQARNPGLQFRTHWITKLSYGRDELYTPYMNDTADSTNAIDWVYFYPGRMPTGSGDDRYYSTEYFASRLNVDGTIRNTYDATANPAPYALADQFNNAMRLPDERNRFDARVAAGLEDATTPTLRLLLEDMYSNPSKYTNAILINLHGELFPFPPIRNYSDAAKDPEDYPGVRVVTHPEKLRYTDTENVKLRVYSYLMNPSAATSVLNTPISIVLKGVNWSPLINGSIERISGDAGSPYTRTVAPAFGPAGEMYYETETVTVAGIPETRIRLYNSPLKTPCNNNCDDGGLPHWTMKQSRRLYGLEYIPSPVENISAGEVAFSTDLTTPGDLTKNTARWIITIPDSVLPNNGRLDIETRIGTDLTTGTAFPTVNEPNNLSRTYVWKGTDLWIFGDANNLPNLPYTERYQILGDPRHLPYADLKAPHAGSGLSGANRLGLGYNPYFDDFESDVDWDADNDIDFADNGAAAELITPDPETWTIKNNTNDRFSVKINGGSTITVDLTGSTSVNLSAGTVANTLNANSTFSAVALATAWGPRLRVVSKTAGPNSSVAFDLTVSRNCGNEMGFTSSNFTSSTGRWDGWQYITGGNTYGIKNDGDLSNDSWSRNNSRIDMDLTRIFEMMRSPLQRSRALWTTMTGWSYYYIGTGGEIGYDSSNGFPDSIRVSGKPFGRTGADWEQSIIDGNSSCNFGCGPKYIRENGTNWWAMTWLGELFPDNRFNVSASVNDWIDRGNLPTATNTTTTGTFRRVNRDAIPTNVNGNTPGGSDIPARYSMTGTLFTDGLTHRTQEPGSTNFFWLGTASNSFRHTGADGNSSNRTTVGGEIASSYAMPVPSTIPSSRPFILSSTGANPDSFLFPGYGSANTGAMLSEFFDYAPNAAWSGSGLMAIVNPSSRDVMYVVGNGLSPSGTSGTAFIARWSLLTLIHSFFTSGMYRYDGTNITLTGTPSAERISQLPQVRITNPNLQTELRNPTNINITWAVSWTRWDGRPYTTNYTAAALALDDDAVLKYAVLYSRDNGATWYHVSDNTEATRGIRPAAAYLQTTTSYSWNVANTTTFPQGNYIIRVEAYREGKPLHYSFHQFRAYIDR